MEKARIETVARAHRVDDLRLPGGDVPVLWTGISRGSLLSALDDQQRNAFAKDSDGTIQIWFGREPACFAFIGHEDVDKGQGVENAAVPGLCWIVVGIEGNGDAGLL